jgi:hypothetical protein
MTAHKLALLNLLAGQPTKAELDLLTLALESLIVNDDSLKEREGNSQL